MFLFGMFILALLTYI
ncbi:putative holin-like toxin, partial [Bacillus altitudinis]|nr:putative holin-like toxin [Bacillus altitudinis]